MLESSHHLQPVPDDCCIIRLGRAPKDFPEDGKVLAIQLGDCFNLSTKDKEGDPPHLSVWVNALTTPEQAYAFLGTKHLQTLVLQLEVDEIRAIVCHSGKNMIHRLDVLWVHLANQDGEGQDLPLGFRGHAGITGLDNQSSPEKLLRKNLRAQLAELASKNCYLLFHE